MFFFRAKMKRDIEEIKKDVESDKTLTDQESFLKNIIDLNLLRKKSLSTSHRGDVVKI